MMSLNFYLLSRRFHKFKVKSANPNIDHSQYMETELMILNHIEKITLTLLWILWMHGCDKMGF